MSNGALSQGPDGTYFVVGLDVGDWEVFSV
jgi:hypothetical protein